MHKPAYRRILLKLSGEALMGDLQFGIDHVACQKVAQEVKQIYDLGTQIGIVIGGGNIFRGSQATLFGFARTPADHIGMLATTINGLLLSQMLAHLGCKTRVMSALNFEGIVDIYNWTQALLHLQEGIIVIFVGGTGNPYFTTDTAAAMRASEIEAEVLLKGTKVNGVYNKDPLKYPDAKMYTSLTYSDALVENLHVMDGTAIALCRDNRIPIHVFNLFSKGALFKAVCETKGGTLIRE